MEPTDQNRRAWDEIHRSRTRTASEQLLIPEQIFDLIPNVEGKHVLHLQCATGEATAVLRTLPESARRRTGAPMVASPDGSAPGRS